MIEAIAACSPKNTLKTIESEHFTADFKERFVRSTGIECRHISDHTTEDLMIGAAELLGDMNVHGIVTVTQTPEYKMPGPGFNIAKRMGVEGGAVFDLNLACDGYIKGLSIANLIAHGCGGKVLLLCGDTLGSVMPKDDQTLGLLFGNAATATIVKPDTACPMFTQSYPSGFNSLCMKDKAHMSGDAVTNFAISKVPEFLKGQQLETADLFYFHQANKMILAMIEKRMKLDSRKVPKIFDQFGNTSSASIPLSMCIKPPQKDENDIVICGFGAGLSISAMRVPKPEFTIYGEI